MKKTIAEQEALIDEMKKEKDEFFHRMEKSLEDSEKKREITELKKEREIQALQAKFEAVRAVEDKERKALVEDLKRDKADVVAVVQREVSAAKNKEMQEILAKKDKDLEATLIAKEEMMKAKFEEKVRDCFNYYVILQ